VIEKSIEAPVVIQEVIHDLASHGTLPNGKKVLAYFESRDTPFPLSPGDHVIVALCLADFSRATILRRDDSSGAPARI
jgi:translation initiation factor IF-1